MAHAMKAVVMAQGMKAKRKGQKPSRAKIQGKVWGVRDSASGEENTGRRKTRSKPLP